MSSRGSYSQKKKKEAVRRLSQQHSRQAARAGPSSGPHELGRKRAGPEKRRRSKDEPDPGAGQRRRGREDAGKRFISPMNNPDLAPGTSAPDTLRVEQFGEPSNVPSDSSESELFTQGKIGSMPGSSLFSQALSSGTPHLAQESSFGDAPSSMFGKPSVPSSSSVFGSQSATFGSQSATFGSFGTGLNPSLFGQGIIDSDSSLEDAGTKQPSFQITFGPVGNDEAGIGDDEAGIGRSIEAQDAPKSDRRILSRDSAPPNESQRSSGSFGQISPRKDEGAFQQPRRTSLKRDLSPSKPSSVSQRPLTSHDDMFGSDISDMESFGSAPAKPKVEKESMQGRAPVKRTGLFGRAVEDASGRREAEPKKQRSEERSPKESSRGKKETSLIVSRSEVNHLTTIIVKDVPDQLNNRIYINKLFSKFGKVKKATVNPRKTMATVYFEDHESAARAKRDVKTLKVGTRPVTIFWAQKDKGKEKRKSDENVPPSNSEIKREADPPPKREKPPPPPAYTGRNTRGLHTASERYEALEEWDKQIRKGMTKKSELATAVKMTGSCPDMCPEKERYMREVQRRLSPYEMMPGQKMEKGVSPNVCHQNAVKEYSRSSADQEEPLPSELRPPAVLDLTMNYLMGEIINREPTGQGGDGRSWADWFDFLWDRTRSIRKEITQQQLCETTAVGLMEKCARFHIYCSYRLCEEGHRSFSPKINNENLTKCMQSLKQFYHDLTDEGVFCPNEAEFRAYEVLLNLTGGDILREVQQYRPEVRNSEAVVFAIKISAAFSSNNYSRFFKLIRGASFLNACILHRYFVQRRSMALETMNKAFTTPKGISPFPAVELVHLLAFEDEDQASIFCECHGLSSADGCIQLSRGGFFYPEETLTSQRAPSVIEAKNDRSIAEVVNNGPLPLAPPHTPVSSFDESGRLLERGAEAKPVRGVAIETRNIHVVQEVKQPVRKIEKQALQESFPMQREIQFQQPQPQAQEVVAAVQYFGETVQQPPQQVILSAKVEESKPTISPTISPEVVKDIIRDIFLEVIDEMVRDLSTRFMGTLVIIQASPKVVAELIDEELGALSRGVARETLDEERYAEALRREQEMRAAEEASKKEQELNALRQEASRQISEEIVEEVVERTLEEMIEKEISVYQIELHRQAIERCSSVVSEELLQDLVGSEVTSISHEVIAMATAERDRRLEEIAEAYRLRQLGYLYQKWCRVHSKRLKIRRALETFPAGPPNQNTAEQLEVLWPKRREQPGGADPDSTSRSRVPLPMSLDTPYGVVTERESLAKHIMHHHYLTLVRQQRAWEPLDLPVIHRDNTHSSQHASSPTWQDGAACRYWKLIASLPQGSHDDRSPCHWLKAKLRRGKISKELRRSRLRDNENVETLSLYTQRAGSTPVGICTKALLGPPAGRDARYQLTGSSGIILMVQGETEACCRDAQHRLNAILSQTPRTPPLPILLCVISDEDVTTFQSSLSESLQCPQLTREGVIASWRVIRLPRDVVKVEASEQLEEGIAWLASHHPKPPPVVSETVKEYLDNGLSQFFSINVHQLTKQRRESGQFSLSPQSIVSLYNSVMSHLSSVASSSSLSDISWPPAEFTGHQHPDLPAADWNTPTTLSHLYTSINILKLPEVPYKEENDWLSVCKACANYVNLLPGRDSDKAPLFSRVRWLLDKSRRTFEDTCFVTFDTEGCEPTSGHAPWADILEECVTYMMTTLSTGPEGECPSSPGNQQVYFHQSEFGSFAFPVQWKQEMNETLEESVVEHESMFDSIMESVSTRRSTLAEEDSREKEERRRRRAEERLPDNTSFLLPEDVTMTISHTQSGLLRRMLDKEREESLRFEAMLTSFLEEPVEELPHTLHVQADRTESEFRLQLPPFPNRTPKASLSKSLEEPRPRTDTPIITLEETDGSLSDQIQSLKERLASEKQAGLVAEMRLNALLGL